MLLLCIIMSPSREQFEHEYQLGSEVVRELVQLISRMVLPPSCLVHLLSGGLSLQCYGPTFTA